MPSARQYLGQALLYGLFFAPLAYFTSAPDFMVQAPELATLKLAVRHAGKIVGACEVLSGAAYEQLPANMKRPEVCPRERSPLLLQLSLDGNVIYVATAEASGLHSDGMASIYKRFAIPAGRHQLTMLMNDDVTLTDFPWQLQQEIKLLPAQVMVLNFKDGFHVQ